MGRSRIFLFSLVMLFALLALGIKVVRPLASEAQVSFPESVRLIEWEKAPTTESDFCR